MPSLLFPYTTLFRSPVRRCQCLHRRGLCSPHISADDDESALPRGWRARVEQLAQRIRCGNGIASRSPNRAPRGAAGIRWLAPLWVGWIGWIGWIGGAGVRCERLVEGDVDVHGPRVSTRNTRGRGERTSDRRAPERHLPGPSRRGRYVLERAHGRGEQVQLVDGLVRTHATQRNR